MWKKADEELSELLILPTGSIHIFRNSMCAGPFPSALPPNMISAPGLLVKQPSDVPSIRMNLTKHFTLLSFPSLIRLFV